MAFIDKYTKSLLLFTITFLHDPAHKIAETMSAEVFISYAAKDRLRFKGGKGNTIARSTWPDLGRQMNHSTYPCK
ncbi:uncharacterized protein METZ01_LOCUS428442 [marine metagenome]|uniref:Uncharacterized protein n=1 Tax=marine metagenome TaxID=408172 RepID=A0A382XZ92_9ZZZZ